MLTVVITGGLASGKSTVAGQLRELGWPVIDADALAHEFLLPGGSAVAEIAARFGPGVVGAQGGIDRSALAARVFAATPRAAEELAALNRILHPRVMAAAESQFESWRRRQAPVAAAEVALVLEAGLRARFDRLILVTCPEEERLRRFLARTGAGAAGAAQARARMAAQWPDAEKRKYADFVIDNSGDPGQTELQALAAARAIAAPLQATL